MTIQSSEFKQVIHVNSRRELDGVLNTIMPNSQSKSTAQQRRVNRAVSAFRKATHKFDTQD